MNPHNLINYAPYTVEDRIGGAYSSYTNTAQKDLNSLQCPVSNPGNHRDPTPFNYFVNKRVYANGIYRFTADTPGGWESHVERGPSIQAFRPHECPPGLVSIAYNKALDRLYDAMRGGLDLSINAFQMKQNLGLVRGTTDLIGLVQKMPLAKRLSSAYLTYQFGWRPLIGDIFGVLDESVRYVLNRIENYKGRGSETDHTVVSMPSVYGQTSDRIKVTSDPTAKVEIGVTAEVPDFDLARWTSLNPVSIAWELVPFSFVVDWFYDIGSTVRNLESALLYRQRFKRGYVSSLQISRYFCEDAGSYHGGGPYGAGNYQWSFTGYGKEIRFSRVALSSMPLPSLPSLKVNLGGDRMFVAAGLLGNMTGRRGRAG